MPPFHTPNPGLGGLAAGFQDTVVRFGSGAPAPQQLILKLEEQVRELRQQNAYLQQIANTTRTQQRNTARTSPLAGMGTNRSPHA